MLAGKNGMKIYKVSVPVNFTPDDNYFVLVRCAINFHKPVYCYRKIFFISNYLDPKPQNFGGTTWPYM